MRHQHDFEHQPSDEGFDGLGKKENESVSADLCHTVYYMIHNCADKNCPVTKYTGWLFEKDSFNICCDDVYPSEPAESMDAKFNDFRRNDEPVVVDFTCRHCGTTQTLESDHIYTKED